jgi:hypothetical protein
MDLDHLTTLLADRLSAIVPTGFHVALADGTLWYSAEQGKFPGQSGDYRVGRAGTYVRDNFGAYGGSDEENIVGVAVQALDDLQDYISQVRAISPARTAGYSTRIWTYGTATTITPFWPASPFHSLMPTKVCLP